MEPIFILGIGGSLRRGSYNRGLLRAAQKLAPEGVRLEIFDLSGIPLFNQDEETQPPPKVVEMKAKVRRADALLFATPEYNYSVPSALKNAIEWGSVPHGDNAWEGKPAAIMGASANRMGTARAQYHLRQIFVFLNVYPVNHPEVMIPDVKDCFNAEGELVDESSRRQIQQLLQSLLAWTRQLQSVQAA